MKGNTWGWQLMTPAERTEHQAKMRSFTTYDECKVYQEERHKQMVARAKEKVERGSLSRKHLLFNGLAF
jgi:hypothetical protein